MANEFEKTEKHKLDDEWLQNGLWKKFTERVVMSHQTRERYEQNAIGRKTRRRTIFFVFFK